MHLLINTKLRHIKAASSLMCSEKRSRVNIGGIFPSLRPQKENHKCKLWFLKTSMTGSPVFCRAGSSHSFYHPWSDHGVKTFGLLSAGLVNQASSHSELSAHWHEWLEIRTPSPSQHECDSLPWQSDARTRPMSKHRAPIYFCVFSCWRKIE